MLLEKLIIERKGYGASKGKLFGKVRFVNEDGHAIETRLDEGLSKKVIEVIADHLVDTTKSVAKLMTAEIIDQLPTLEKPYVDDAEN